MEQQTFDAAQALAQQQLINSGFYPAGEDVAAVNTREFYLAYEELLEEAAQGWRGLIKEAGEWKDKGIRVMDEAAITTISNHLRTFLSVPVRLGDLEEDEVLKISYEGTQTIIDWLHKVGWVKYGVNIEHFDMIIMNVFTIVRLALTWSKRSGGKRLMTTSIRSVEQVSQMINHAQRSSGAERPVVPKPW